MGEKVMHYGMKEEFLAAQQEIEKDQFYAKVDVGNVGKSDDVVNLMRQQKEEVKELNLFGKRIRDMSNRSVTITNEIGKRIDYIAKCNAMESVIRSVQEKYLNWTEWRGKFNRVRAQAWAKRKSLSEDASYYNDILKEEER